MRQPFLITVGSSLDDLICKNDDDDDDNDDDDDLFWNNDDGDDGDDYDDNNDDDGDKETDRVRQPFLITVGSSLDDLICNNDDDDNGDDGWHYFLRNDSDNKLKAF